MNLGVTLMKMNRLEDALKVPTDFHTTKKIRSEVFANKYSRLEKIFLAMKYFADLQFESRAEFNAHLVS